MVSADGSPEGRRDMRRSVAAPIMVAFFSVAAGGWLLQQGVDRAENVYVRVRVLQEVVDRVESSFVDEVDASRLYDSAIDGLIRDLGDPHSSFMPASEFEDLRIRTEGEYGGVGLEVVDRNGYVTVVSPIPGGPGGRDGYPGRRPVLRDRGRRWRHDGHRPGRRTPARPARHRGRRADAASGRR